MKKKALIIREIFKGDHNAAAAAAAAARKPSMKTNKRPFSKGRLIISEEMQHKTYLLLWGTLTPPGRPWMKTLRDKGSHIKSRCIYLSTISIIKRFIFYLRRTSCLKNGIFQHKNGCGGHFVFRNGPKVIPREVHLTKNIPRKFKKASSKIAACRAVTSFFHSLARKH